MRRSLALAALCAFPFGVMALSAGPAGADPLSDCTAHRGTIVAVDFAHWGGPLVRGCGIDQPTGYALLHAGGFTTAGDAHDGAAFICRLGNQAFDGGTMYPTPSEDPCIGTPSTSAYWSYWLAPAGRNTWTYSAIGPLGDVPKPGEVELWMFGSTNVGGTRGSGVPRFPPSMLRPHSGTPTTPTPTQSNNTHHTATHTSSGGRSRGKSAQQSSARRPTTTDRRQSRRPQRKRHGAPAPSRHAAASSPPMVSAQPTSEHTSSGSVGPLVVGLSLALALAAGAAWTVWRRRRYG